MQGNLLVVDIVVNMDMVGENIVAYGLPANVNFALKEEWKRS